MKRRQHTRGGKGGGGGGGGGGKNQREEQPISGILMTTTRATRHQNKASSSASALTDILVRPLLVECLTYLDQQSLREVCLLSTVFLDIVRNDKGMENHRIIQLLEIRPSKNNEDDENRLLRLFQQLYRHRDKLQQYREVRIINGHKFVWKYNNLFKVEEYTRKLHLSGVVSLISINSSASPTRTSRSFEHVTNALAIMMPNLREVHLSNCGIRGILLKKLVKHCSRLEKLTINNVQQSMTVSATGVDMVHAKNLRDLNMDNSSFSCTDITCAKMSDLENALSSSDDNSTIFLFHKCDSTVLERISIKNAMWCRLYNNKPHSTVIPQNALIKFIRNAPLSLRYFGSDLSQANIEMLRSEEGGRGSEIEFG